MTRKLAALTDGLVWTELGSLPMGSAILGYDPALSPNGCYVVFSGEATSTNLDLYIAVRGPDGAFMPPTRLAKPSSTTVADIQPAIDPTQSRVWYVQGGALIEGRP